MRTSAILATLLASVFILSLPAVALTPHTSTADLTVESGTADWDAFSWEWASQTERMAITLPEPITAGNVLIRMYRDVYGDIALEAGPFSVDGTGTNATLEITSTNIPTWALYYADIMQIDESATPDQYKSLGRGTIKRAWSAWDTTNFVGTTTSVQLVYSYGTNDTILWNQTYDWVHAYSNLTPTYAWVQSYVATNAGAALQLTAGSTQPLSGELYLGSPTAPQDSTSIIRLYLGASSTNYLLAGFGRVDDHYRQRLRWLNPGVVAEMDVNYYPLANYIDYLDSDLRTTHVATNNDSLVNFLCLNTALGGYVATSNATYTNTVALAAGALQATNTEWSVNLADGTIRRKAYVVGGPDEWLEVLNLDTGDYTWRSAYNTNMPVVSGNTIRMGVNPALLGVWSVPDATSGAEPMNFQTATGLIAEAVAPLVSTNYAGNVALGGNLSVSGEITGSGNAPKLRFNGTNTTVLSGAVIGEISFENSDISNNTFPFAGSTASIRAIATRDFTSTGGADTDLIFLTNDQNAPTAGTNLTLIERMRITSAGNVSVSNLTVSGTITAGNYSATITPYLITAATNITISAENGLHQAVTGALPASVTINFPTASATSELTISLTLPPRGTNAVTLAAGPTYYYVSPLSSTNAASTNLYTRYYVASPYGTTNVSVTVSGEVP